MDEIATETLKEWRTWQDAERRRLDARLAEEQFAADRREEWAASLAASNAGRVRVEAAHDIICGKDEA